MRGESSYYRLRTRNRLFFFFFRFYFLSLSLDLALALVLILSASFLLRCLFFPLARRGFLVFGDGRPLVASSSSSWILNFLGSCSSSDQTKETRKVQRAKWYGWKHQRGKKVIEVCGWLVRGRLDIKGQKEIEVKKKEREWRETWTSKKNHIWTRSM